MAIKTVKFTLNGQTYDLALDSSSGTYKATITAPGFTSWNENTDHKFHGEVVVTDEGGNSATATVTDFSALGLRVLEKVKPEISVTYPTSGAYLTTAKPSFTWTVTDAGSGVDESTISIQIDGQTAVTSGITKTAVTNGYSCSYTPTAALSEGSHTVYFNVTDNDGNTATQGSVNFTVDTVPPTLNITGPNEGYTTNNATVTVSGTTNDDTSSPVTIQVTVNDGTAQNAQVDSSGNFSINVTLTKEGTNTVTILATDAAGKTTQISRTVTLDTGDPVITAVTLTPNPVDAGATYIITVTVTD